MSRKALWWIAGGCGLVIVGVCVLAVVLNQREARKFDQRGVHTTAQVTDKHTWKERRGKTDEIHYCMTFSYTTTSGSADSGSSCDQGVDQIFDRTNVGDQARIVYLDHEVMLEDWATGKLTSF